MEREREKGTWVEIGGESERGERSGPDMVVGSSRETEGEKEGGEIEKVEREGKEREGKEEGGGGRLRKREREEGK